MLPISEVIEKVEGLGFERVEHIRGSTFKDNSTVILIPTRGMIHHRVVTSWQNLIAPMNQKRAIFFCSGDEVGQAYNNMVEMVIGHPELSKWKYILTLEDDNIVPPDAHIRLLESIELGFDAVGGLYFTKGDINMPMAYGSPEEYTRTGVLDFRPRATNEVIAAGQVLAVNGIAMGCSLYKMDLFRTVPKPWFVSLSDFNNGSPAMMTQDLYFCQRAVQAGKRFGVDCRVKVGHLDISTGIVY